jgi:hypothetical protein
VGEKLFILYFSNVFAKVARVRISFHKFTKCYTPVDILVSVPFIFTRRRLDLPLAWN